MKKRLFSALLVLLITLALVACSATPSAGNTNDTTENTQNIDPQSNPFAFLKAAGEKLKNAESFQMDILHWAMNPASAVAAAHQ